MYAAPAAGTGATAACAGEGAATIARKYNRWTLGKYLFVVDTRYTNVKPIGRGAYGLVCSADDLVGA